MGFRQSWIHFFVRNARPVNITISSFLLLLSLACYPLFLILFFRPTWYNRESLVHPDVDSSITPAVAVGLVSALFASTTAALVTRCVEHSLWHQLQPRSSNKEDLTVGEIRNLANWTISVTAKLTYLFMGSSWLLKVTGVLLLLLSILNPVIVSGISQTQHNTTTTEFRASQGFRFAGYIDAVNANFNGGNFRDIPGTAAAIISLNNLTAPPSSICPVEQRTTCHASVLAASIRAECKASTLPNSKIATTSRNITTESFCSSFNSNVCATLRASNPVTFADFKGDRLDTCGSTDGSFCPGDFSVILGAFLMKSDFDSTTPTGNINVVDCALLFGNVTIKQTDRSSPTLDRNTFQKSQYRLRSAFGGITSLQRLYMEDGATQSAFTFGGNATGTGGNSLYRSTLGMLLLGSNLDVPAEIVARRIEAAFDTQTLFAFARRPEVADTTFTYERASRFVYVYDARVLFVLLSPLLATVLGYWGRWWVGGMDVVGYDVVRIARMGPVAGLEGKETEHEDIDDVKIRCVDEGIGRKLVATGSASTRFAYHSVE